MSLYHIQQYFPKLTRVLRSQGAQLALNAIYADPVVSKALEGIDLKNCLPKSLHRRPGKP